MRRFFRHPRICLTIDSARQNPLVVTGFRHGKQGACRQRRPCSSLITGTEIILKHRCNPHGAYNVSNFHMAPRNVRFSSGSPDKLLIPSCHDMQWLASLDEDEEMLTEDDLPDTPSSPLCKPPFELSPAQTTCTTRPEPSFQSPGSPRSPLIEPAWESFAPSPSSSSPLIEPPWDSISTCLSDGTPLLEPAWDKSPPPVSPGTPLHEPPWGSPPPFQSPPVSPLQELAFQSPAATRSSAHIYPTQAAGQSS
ncbi:hypothetical protein M404DRAFT_34656 [Pisolithus tinctorius Marx 270]|uniref:Uncharacterized protein n=1 Tax=Pisolithus tinctorius Marx 270 TaxID=870435 RepID=A0A0C3N1D9_PISTI|nr:hypothetical protein M404DRAFT_34656 [Pisolithus tinctorius Marx 270]